MFKKTTIAVPLMLAFAATPLQAGNYGYAGCGLGAVIWERNQNRGVQLLALTTNYSSNSQTFGISSGTSECTEGGAARKEKAREIFVAANIKDITREMAAGTGEYVAALGLLSGCNSRAIPAFGKKVQANYERIYPSATVEPNEVIRNLDSVIASDAALSQSCKG